MRGWEDGRQGRHAASELGASTPARREPCAEAPAHWRRAIFGRRRRRAQVEAVDSDGLQAGTAGPASGRARAYLLLGEEARVFLLAAWGVRPAPSCHSQRRHDTNGGANAPRRPCPTCGWAAPTAALGRASRACQSVEHARGNRFRLRVKAPCKSAWLPGDHEFCHLANCHGFGLQASM